MKNVKRDTPRAWNLRDYIRVEVQKEKSVLLDFERCNSFYLWIYNIIVVYVVIFVYIFTSWNKLF